MNYVNLGRSGLKVSRLCLGMLSFGRRAEHAWVLDEAESRPFAGAPWNTASTSSTPRMQLLWKTPDGPSDRGVADEKARNDAWTAPHEDPILRVWESASSYG
jgi:hypothetical protein